MKLNDILQEKKPSIVKRWFDAVLESYPEGARGPFGRREAQFTNPVGFTLAEGIEGLFDALLKGMIPDTVSAFLDGMIRIRAVQDFTPSQAVAFIFRVKTIVREELGDAVVSDRGMAAQLSTLDSTIDDLALFAFDIYMKCREKIYDIKAQEARNMTFRLLQQANLIAGNKG
jgi:hypothetical protein